MAMVADRRGHLYASFASQFECYWLYILPRGVVNAVYIIHCAMQFAFSCIYIWCFTILRHNDKITARFYIFIKRSVSTKFKILLDTLIFCDINNILVSKKEKLLRQEHLYQSHSPSSVAERRLHQVFVLGPIRKNDSAGDSKSMSSPLTKMHLLIFLPVAQIFECRPKLFRSHARWVIVKQTYSNALFIEAIIFI